MNKRVIITGGAGFIGRYVAREMAARGWHVRVVDDFSASQNDAALHQLTTDIITADIRDTSSLTQALEGADAVVHLAALVSVPVSIAQPEKCHAINTQGFRNVLSVLEKQGFSGRVVYASSAAVYGAEDKPICREDMAQGAQLLSPYAISKAQNEADAAASKTDCIGLRFFNVYGAGQDPSSPYSGVLAKIAQCAQNNQPFTLFGDGSQTRDFIHVADVARSVADVLTTPAQLPAVINIGTGSTTPLHDVPPLIARTLGVEVVVQSAPARAGDILHSCADITTLKTVFPNWNPAPLQVGLQRWLKP